MSPVDLLVKGLRPDYDRWWGVPPMDRSFFLTLLHTRVLGTLFNRYRREKESVRERPLRAGAIRLSSPFPDWMTQADGGAACCCASSGCPEFLFFSFLLNAIYTFCVERATLQFAHRVKDDISGVYIFGRGCVCVCVMASSWCWHTPPLSSCIHNWHLAVYDSCLTGPEGNEREKKRTFTHFDPHWQPECQGPELFFLLSFSISSKLTRVK